MTVLCGLPGMGKDTFIRQHCADLPIVSLDDLRRQHNIKPDNRDANGWIAQQAKEQARIYLREHKPFVWNATNITRKCEINLSLCFIVTMQRLRWYILKSLMRNGRGKIMQETKQCQLK